MLFKKITYIIVLITFFFEIKDKECYSVNNLLFKLKNYIILY